MFKLQLLEFPYLCKGPAIEKAVWIALLKVYGITPGQTTSSLHSSISYLSKLSLGPRLQTEKIQERKPPLATRERDVAFSRHPSASSYDMTNRRCPTTSTGILFRETEQSRAVRDGLHFRHYFALLAILPVTASTDNCHVSGGHCSL